MMTMPEEIVVRAMAPVGSTNPRYSCFVLSSSSTSVTNGTIVAPSYRKTPPLRVPISRRVSSNGMMTG